MVHFDPNHLGPKLYLETILLETSPQYLTSSRGVSEESRMRKVNYWIAQETPLPLLFIRCYLQFSSFNIKAEVVDSLIANGK